MAGQYADKTKAEVVSQLVNLKKRGKAALEKGKEGMQEMLRLTLVGGTCFGMSYLAGRMQDNTGNWDLLGAPVTLWTAGGTAAIGLYMAFTSKSSGDSAWVGATMSVSSGALAAYLAKKGTEMGQKAKSGTSTAGRLPAAQIRHLPPPQPLGSVSPAYGAYVDQMRRAA